MAINDPVSSNRSIILQGDVSRNRPNSEAINTKIAANINAILQDTPPIVFTANGFFKETQISNAIDGVVRIPRDVEIQSYYMSIDELALDGTDTVSINVGVYDANDIFINNLFGSTTNRLLISSNSNVSGVVIGKDSDGNNISDNTSGATTVQTGNLNITTLLEGYKLRCFIENSLGNSKNLRLEIKAA